jgi:uncharacterized protein YbgA (DUF1722 family)
MYRVIYISSAVSSFTSSQLEEMLYKFRAYNNKHNITGILLYVDGDFIQVMEGEKKEIVKLFDNIKRDTRHKGIITLFEGFTKYNQFPDWRMGFSKSTYSELGSLVEENELNKKTVSHYDDHMAMVLINSFVKNHRSKVVIH